MEREGSLAVGLGHYRALGIASKRQKQVPGGRHLLGWCYNRFNRRLLGDATESGVVVAIGELGDTGQRRGGACAEEAALGGAG